jgi:hypothetical protein
MVGHSTTRILHMRSEWGWATMHNNTNEIISDVEHYFALPSALAASKWLLFRDVRILGVSGVGREWAGRGNAA